MREKPFILIIEGGNAVGKSFICKELREKIKYVTLLDLNGCPDKSKNGERKMFDYHKRIFDFFEDTSNCQMNYICCRSYKSETVYCKLGYKPYTFEKYDKLLTNYLSYLTKYYDIYFILLTTDEDTFGMRLNRDKVEYHKFSVENSIKQQNMYKCELKEMTNDLKDVKIFEIENDNSEKVINTIKDIILNNMVGD